ncbi:MAG TPA: hypothetical protein VGA61_07590, partial [Anaerolineae bacterium]
VTAVTAADDWQMISVAGLKDVDAQGHWRLIEDGAWFGLVIVHRLPDGQYMAAVEGADAYPALLAATPARLVGPRARQDLLPSPVRGPSAATTLRFPWQPGSQMLYGTLGVHNSDFASWVTGWKAVDLLSDGNTAAGHAPNRLLASAAGTIGPVCNDGTSVAIRMDSGGSPQLLYVHLQNNASLHTGMTFNQGDQIGQLRPGYFNAPCGWANQAPNWFHVHYGFPAASGFFQVENWTLNLTDQIWYNGSQTRTTGQWLPAGVSGLTAPTLITPTASLTVTTISDLTFTWSPVANATGYQIEWSGGPYTNTLPLGWFAATAYDVGTIAAGEYTWRVRARSDPATVSPWSETRRLTAVAPPPAAFLPVMLAH